MPEAKWRRMMRWLSGRIPAAASRAVPHSGQHADAAQSNWRIQSIFLNYRRILDLNNGVLDLMAEMERVRGGEFIFDRAFLEDSVRRLSALVHHITYNLNVLTGNAHVALYDRFQEIQEKLHQILSGQPLPDPGVPIVPFERIDWDMEPQVGLPAVCLTQLRKHSFVRVMDGFVVTTAAGFDLLAGSGRPVSRTVDLKRTSPEVDDARADKIRQAIRHALEIRSAASGCTHFTVSLVMAGAPLQPPAAIRTGVPPSQVAPAIAEILAQQLNSGVNMNELAPVTMVQEEMAADIRGEILTRVAPSDLEPSRRMDLLQITACSPAAPDSCDRYLLRRAHPFDQVLSDIAARPSDQRPGDGRRPFKPGPDGLLRGSALLPETTARELAEDALILERLLGSTCKVTWCLPSDGRPAVCGVAPLVADAQAQTELNLPDIIAHASVLCRGGQTVQSGIAAGIVVHVHENFPPQTFPAGAIAVAPTASPRLAPLLQRSGAILTATGTAAGHLATVARELRVPAVFGLPNLLKDLPAGVRVTVDAAEGVVYEGILDGLLRYSGADSDLAPSDPEYRLLRRLLRFIQPLYLVDPQAPDFTPQGCRSYHDIIHFCHERAVNELAHLHDRQPDLGGLITRRLQTGVPLEMRVLDIGGGLAPGAADPIAIKDLRCEPLSVFLEGVNRSGAWENTPADLQLRDVLAGLSLTTGALNTSAANLTGNLAIIGSDYLNLSLRLGYHFSVVDALLNDDSQRSYVYFRFVGGLADAQRRERRARFIYEVLSTLDFNVIQKGDLVVGRLKLVTPYCLRTALRTLGTLTAFTRQRDTVMHADADLPVLFKSFANLIPSCDVTGHGGREGRDHA
jgi:pyruvate,water dikinase